MNRQTRMWLAACTVIVGGAVLIYVKDKPRQSALPATASAHPIEPPTAPPPTVPLATAPLATAPLATAPLATVQPAAAPAVSQIAEMSTRAPLAREAGPASAAELPAPQPAEPRATEPQAVSSKPREPVKADPELRYTAKRGDTVNNLAGALLGGETKTNRDAIVNANSSLQVNADHVVAGRTYRIPAPDGLSAASQPAAPSPVRPTTRPDADDIIQASAARNLRYTAKSGDTVTSLAVALLGSDTKANRDAIIDANASLKTNPDRVVIGQVYWIPAPAADVKLSR